MEMHILTEQGFAAKLWCQHDISFPQAGPYHMHLRPLEVPLTSPNGIGSKHQVSGRRVEGGVRYLRQLDA